MRKKKKKTAPVTEAQLRASANYKTRMVDRGFVRIQRWVPGELKSQVDEAISKILEENNNETQ